MEHLSEHTLRWFFEGKATPQESRQIVAHLLHGCDACAVMAVRVFSPPVSACAFDEVFDRVERRIVPCLGGVHLPVLQGTAASIW